MTNQSTAPRHVATCPGCGQSLGLPAGRGVLQYRCPACGHQGRADTGASQGHATSRPASAPPAAYGATSGQGDGSSWPLLLGGLAGVAAGVVLAASGALWSDLDVGPMLGYLLAGGLLAMMLAGVTLNPLHDRWERSRPRLANLCMAGIFCLLAMAVTAPVYGWALGGRDGYDTPWRLLANAAPESWQARLQAVANAHLVHGDRDRIAASRGEEPDKPVKASATTPEKAAPKPVSSTPPGPARIAAKRPVPEFPQVAMERGISGCCLAMARIGESGVPVATGAVCTDDVFEYAARRAMQRARFASGPGSTEQATLKFAPGGQAAPACPGPGSISVANLSPTPSAPIEETPAMQAALAKLASRPTHGCGEPPQDGLEALRLAGGERGDLSHARQVNADIRHWTDCRKQALTTYRGSYNEAVGVFNRESARLPETKQQLDQAKTRIDRERAEISHAIDTHNANVAQIDRLQNELRSESRAQRRASASTGGRVARAREPTAADEFYAGMSSRAATGDARAAAGAAEASVFRGSTRAILTRRELPDPPAPVEGTPPQWNSVTTPGYDPKKDFVEYCNHIFEKCQSSGRPEASGSVQR